jgi:cytochrome b561
VPDLPSDLAPWQAAMARATHWGLYLLIFLMPFTGFFYTALAGFPVPFFGLGDLGALVATNKPRAEFFELAHLYLQYVLYALVALHVGGALQHHFWRKDGVLLRMTSSTKPLPPMTEAGRGPAEGAAERGEARGS